MLTDIDVYKRQISLLGLEDVVISVAVGRKGIGKFEFRLTDGDDERRVHIVSHRVVAIHERDEEFHGENAALREDIIGVFIVAHQERLRLALPREAPFIERRVVANLCGIGREAGLHGGRPIVGRLVGFRPVVGHNGHAGFCRLGVHAEKRTEDPQQGE